MAEESQRKLGSGTIAHIPRERGSLDSQFLSTPQQPATPQVEPPQGAWNPWCCGKIQTGVICVAVAGLVLSTLWLIASIVFPGSLIQGLFYIFTGLVGLSAAIVLGVGIKKKSAKLVKIGFGGYIAMMVLLVICQVLAMTVPAMSPDPPKETATKGPSTTGSSTTTTAPSPTTTKKPVDKEHDKNMAILFGILTIATVIAVYGYMNYVIYAFMRQMSWTGVEVMPESAAASRSQISISPAGPRPSLASKGDPPEVPGGESQEIPQGQGNPVT